MTHGKRFWIMMAVFQVFFGLSVFAITREYYARDIADVHRDPTSLREPLLEWTERMSRVNPAPLNSITSNQPALDDPVQISRQADQHFASKQYAMAANLYERLLAFGPTTADTHNNLGLTLHYLGRSNEALQRLNEGIALDPANQRIWLTLGFVNNQLGDIEAARAALTTAADMDAASDVGRSAKRMLDELP